MMMMMMMKYISRLMTTQFVTIDHNTTAGKTARSSPHYIFQSKKVLQLNCKTQLMEGDALINNM